jgi:hypothetical protein
VAPVNPFLFVVGCPRSGTTLLQRLLDAHPQLAVIDETRWIDRWFAERKGVTPEGFATRALVSNLFELPRFVQLGIRREELETLVDGGRSVPYPSFVSGIFDLYGASQGKALVGDKTPRYLRSIPLLHEFFPTAKFVHLIRDGRSTCLSVLNWQKAAKLARTFPTWNEEPVATAALWWEWQVRLGREAGSSLGSSLYREVRYEALVDDPAGSCRELCAFLGLHYDEAMLRFHEGRMRDDAGLDAKKAWLPPTSGLRDWGSEMSRDEIERFEAAGGGLLDELGYPRAVTHPSTDAASAAIEIRDAFTRELRARGRRLPKTWAVPTGSG